MQSAPETEKLAAEYILSQVDEANHSAVLRLDGVGFSRRYQNKFPGIALNSEHISSAFKALGADTLLQNIVIIGIPVDERGAKELGRQLDNQPELEILHVSNAKITHSAMETLAPAIKRHPKLLGVEFERTGLTEQLVKTFFKEGYHPRLASIGMGFNPEAYTTIAECMTRDATKNLIDFGTLGDIGLTAMLKNNRRSIGELLDSLSEPNYETLNGADLRRAFEQSDTLNSKWLKTHWQGVEFASSKKTAFFDNPNRMADFKNLLDSLPTLGKPEDIFTPNETGFAPLDNPRLWEGKSIEDFKAIPLSKELLEKRTPKGSGLLDSALFAFPADEVVAHLNTQGVQLRSDALLTADGKPSLIMEQLVESKAVSTVFTVDNWLGASKQELHRVHQALPEAQRSNVGIMTLAQQISTSNQARGR